MTLGGALGTGALSSSLISQGTSTAFNGIDYEAGGSIGWSKDNFTSGIKSGLINMTVSSALGGVDILEDNKWASAGITGFVNAGVDTSGDWNDPGWNDSKDAVAAGIAAGAASYASGRLASQQENATDGQGKNILGPGKSDFGGDFSKGGYANKLIYNTINSGLLSMYNMAEYDLSWSDASQQSGFYSGMIYDHKDLAGYAGSKVGEWAGSKFDAYKDYQNEKTRNGLPAGAEDPYSRAEEMLYVMFEGLRRSNDAVANIFNSITDGVSMVDNSISDGLMMSDREISRVQALSLLEARKEYAGHQNYMAAQSLQLSDIADAVNAANNGGARGDANANMSKLLTALNNKFGLDGEDRITSAEDMQAVISSGRVNVNDVMTVALESSNSNATFANVYGVAGGVRSGSLVADDNGFYTKGGQMVAGRYVEPGTADYNKMIAGLYDNKILSDKIMAQQVYEKNNPGFAKRFALAAGSVVNSFLSSTATTAEAKGMDFTLNGKSKIENLNWFDAGSSYSRWGFNMLQNSLESKLQSSRPFFSTNPSNDEIKEFGLEYLKSDGGNIGVTLGQGFADQYKNYFLSSKNIEDWLIYTMGATASYAGYVASNKEVSTMTHIPVAKVGDETVKVKASYGWENGDKVKANIQSTKTESEFSYESNEEEKTTQVAASMEFQTQKFETHFDYNHTEFENGKTGYTAGAGVSWNYNGFYAGFNFTDINTLENLEKLDDGSYTYQPRVGFNTTYTGGYNTTVNNFNFGIDVSYSHTVLENRKNEKDMKWWVTGTYYHNWLK